MADRVTQAGLLVLQQDPAQVRVSQVGLLVLRSTEFDTNISVSATTNFTLSVAADGADVKPAVVGFTISDHAIGVRARPVNATTSFTLAGLAGEVRDAAAVAVTRLILAINDRDPDVPRVDVAATSAFTFSDLGEGHPSESIFVNAETRFSLAALAGEIGILKVAATTTFSMIGQASARTTNFPVSATTAFVLGDGPAHGSVPHVWVVTAADRIELRTPSSGRHTIFFVDATDQLLFSDATSGHDGNPKAVATGQLRFTDVASAHNAAIHVGAITSFSLGDFASRPSRNSEYPVIARDTLHLTDSAGAVRDAVVAAEDTIVLADAGSGGRAISVSAITHMSLGSPADANHYWPVAGVGGFTLGDVASGLRGSLFASSRFVFSDRADGSVELLPGGGAAGPSSGTGLRNVLRGGGSGDWPNSYAETSDGLLLVANGVDPMIRWDGLAALADAAGVPAPADMVLLGGMGVGGIVGRRVAFQRFIDRFGNESNLSPVSNEVDFGRDQLIDNVTYDPASGVVTIDAEAHGLLAGEAVVIGGVEGIPTVNGARTVTPTGPDTFTLNGVLVTSGVYTQGGYWTWGVAMVGYTAAAPTDPRVVRRQLLRNLAGNAETFYVDVDTTDLVATTFLSSRTDDDLAAQASVPLVDDDELPFANSFHEPPSHKAVILAHQGRIFATADVTITMGHVRPIFGSEAVLGVGTEFRTTFAGRFLYVVGATRAYEILAVDEASQTITLTQAYADATPGMALFAVRSAPGERRLVYYTEAGISEAWPPWNALSVPENGDDLAGLMVQGPFLYLLERRHIWKLTFQGDPAEGFLFLTTERGCLNDRCHVQVEDTVYLLDELGLHKFDGQTSATISDPIQPLFQQGDGDGLDGMLRVNWDADQRLWHAAHDPVRDTIRWFVAFDASRYPDGAICYNVRQQRFWLERYPWAITSSATVTLGYRRSLVGSEARRVLCLAEGSLDGIEQGSDARGFVTSATTRSLTDASAPFVGDLGGATVAIVDGRGAGQQRAIDANTGDTLRITTPWIRLPDSTSVYQVGGIAWSWRSGWFRHALEERDNPRDIEVVYQPLRTKDGLLDVSLYYDHSETPRSFAYPRKQDGVETQQDSPRIVVDLATATGYAMQRLDGHREEYAHGDRFVQVRLAGVQAGEAVRIFGLTVRGAEAEGDEG